MTAVKTIIGGKDQAEAVPFSPTAEVPETNVWDAIKSVQAGAAADLAAHEVAADPHPQYLLETDATETVEDVVGALLGADSGDLDFTYNDAGNAISVVVKADAVDNTKAANMAEATIKGRARGAGTGNPTDLSVSQARDVINQPVDISGTDLNDLMTSPSGIYSGQNLTNAPTAGFYTVIQERMFNSSLYGTQTIIAAGVTPTMHVRHVSNGTWGSTFKLWYEGNDGASSGLDADVLDGQDGAYYLSRANHTGSQTASTISDFTEAVQDVAGALFGDDGGDLDWTYNDGANTLGGAIKNDAVTYAKIQNISAADRLLGRATSGAGDAEEITCTAAGRALIDDADASTQRTTLGLGTAATQNTGTSGASVPLLNGANTWSAAQSFTTAAIDLQVGQITFPATQNASVNANTLDDYEEGTFTPVVEGTTTAGTASYVSQVGRYTKVGNTVIFTVAVNYNTHTGTGNMKITGLPFSSNAAGGNATSVRANNLTFAGSLPQALVGVSTTEITLETVSSGGAATALAIDAAAALQVTGSYQV